MIAFAGSLALGSRSSPILDLGIPGMFLVVLPGVVRLRHQ